MAKRKGYLLSIEGRRIGFRGTDAKALTPEIAAELLITMVRRIGHTVSICKAEDKEQCRYECSGSSATSMNVRSMGWIQGKA